MTTGDTKYMTPGGSSPTSPVPSSAAAGGGIEATAQVGGPAGLANARESSAPHRPSSTEETTSTRTRYTRCAGCERIIIERDGLPIMPGAQRVDYAGLPMHEVCAIRRQLQRAVERIEELEQLVKVETPVAYVLPRGRLQ